MAAEASANAVRLLTPERETDWKRLVESVPDSTVFHTLGWYRAVAESFRYRPAHQLVYGSASECPIAAVPGFLVPEPTGVSVVNPFCEYGFPLVHTKYDEQAVLACLASETTSPFGARILKDAQWTGHAEYPIPEYGGTRTGYTVRVPTDGPEDPSERFDDDVHRGVRIARENGVTVEPADPEALYPRYLETMRRLGSPPFPEQFFVALGEHLPDSAITLLARIDDEVVAGVLLFEWGDATMVWANASNPAYWDAKPNHLLYARSINRAVKQGRRVVDLGRTRSESGVAEFKAKFGGTRSSLASLVAPPHRQSRASLESYTDLQALTKRLSLIVGHRTVGPLLKEAIHE